MEVRRLTEADLDAFFASRLRALETNPTAFMTSLAEDKAKGGERFRATLQRTDDDHVIFGAVEGGKVVGTAGVFRGDRLKTMHKAAIVGMFVDPEHRKQGLGAQLLDLAIAQARKMGADAAYLSLEAENAAARKLYESRGFKAWGREPRAMKADGRFYDETHMVLLLT